MYESNRIALNRGVPQGIVLGPLLFSIYVNYMKDDTVVNSNITQYVDDTFIFAVQKQFRNQNYILKRESLNSFFFQENELNVNESKPEFIFWSP